MYPSGDTQSVGGGDQTMVKPRDANSLAFLPSSTYHFPDSWDTQLNHWHNISKLDPVPEQAGFAIGVIKIYRRLCGINSGAPKNAISLCW
jgi:hypothetical protein